MTAVFATMLVSTVVLAALDRPVSPDSGAAAADSNRATPREPGPPAPPRLPILVHLMLDEHIGIQGLSEDVPQGRGMRRFLRDFFDRYGFRVFARAYSHYSSTYNSLPNLVNFASEPVDGAFISGEVEPYVLLSNRYFELLGHAGYNIHVYLIHYMDFCASAHEYIASCTTREVTGIKALESVDIPVWDKVTLICRRFAELSALKAAAEERYGHIRQVLHSAGWILPEWWLKGDPLAPIKDLALCWTMSLRKWPEPRPAKGSSCIYCCRISRTCLTRCAIFARLRSGSYRNQTIANQEQDDMDCTSGK